VSRKQLAESRFRSFLTCAHQASQCPCAPFPRVFRRSQIGTKGGIVFYTVLGIALPFVAYNYMLEELEWDIVLAGNVILVLYVGLATVLWTGSYVFRVANKDMTYAQQVSRQHALTQPSCPHPSPPTAEA
jgi:hypothetical protein